MMDQYFTGMHSFSQPRLSLIKKEQKSLWAESHSPFPYKALFEVNRKFGY